MNLTLTKPIACWQQEYNTGNSQVDRQHQQLFEIVNALHDAVVNKKNIYTQELLEALANHTIEHFQTEEALMMAVDYPEYDRHKHTHDCLLSKVDRLLLELRDRNTAAVTTEITQFLTEWLAHHIKGEDQKMIQFFQNQ